MGQAGQESLSCLEYILELIPVTLYRTTYTDPNGVERTWESSERCTRPEGVDFDGVGIIAVLENPGQPPELLLQKQYRPPIGKVHTKYKYTLACFFGENSSNSDLH